MPRPVITKNSMPVRAAKPKSSDRVAIIAAVKTYLGFFVLLVLVVETVLGALGLRTEGKNQLAALYGMLLVIAALIAVVSFFAYHKPETLLRTVGTPGTSKAQSLQELCRRIPGYWWERITPEDPSAISFLDIRPDRATSTVKMTGSAYAKDGAPAATWESSATCINPVERKLFYYWEGRHPSRPNEPYEGFEEFAFHEFFNRIDRGVGLFSDTNLTDMKTTTKKSVELRRSPPAEIRVMQEGSDKFIAEMIRKKLGRPAGD